MLRYFLLALIAVTLAMGTFAKRGLLDWRRMLRQTEELQAKIEGAEKTRRELENSIEQLQTNPVEQEKIVRSRLGYVRANETIVEFE